MPKHHTSYSGVREGTEWLSYREFPWLKHLKPKTRGRSAMEKRIAKALRMEHGLSLTKEDVERYGPPFLAQQREERLLNTRIARMKYALYAISDLLRSEAKRKDAATTMETAFQLANMGLVDELRIELDKDKEAGRFDEERE